MDAHDAHLFLSLPSAKLCICWRTDDGIVGLKVLCPAGVQLCIIQARHTQIGLVPVMSHK